MDIPSSVPTPPPVEPQASSIRASIARLVNFFKIPSKNQKVTLVTTFTLLIVVFGWWAHQGFTLKISEFFAAGNGPQIVINTGNGPYSHGNTLSVSWSKNDAVRCDSLNGWINTGGAKEGTATSLPINACSAEASSGTGQINIQCTFADGSVGNTTANFTIDASTCPGTGETHLTCQNKACVEVAGPQGSDTTCLSDSECQTAPVLSDCAKNHNAETCLTGSATGGASAHGTVANSEDASTPYTVRLAVYKVVKVNDDLSSQVLWSVSSPVTVNAGATKSLTASVPDCRYQVDLFQGEALEPPFYQGTGQPNSGHFLVAYTYSGGTTLCDVATPVPSVTTPPPTPTVSKTPTPTPTISRTPTPTPTPSTIVTCQPRPSCLDATPACSIPEPVGGWCPTTTPSGMPVMTIDKLVRDVNDNTAELDSVTADPQEIVEFIIRIRSTGNTTVQAAKLRDGLPVGLTYIPGSSTINDASVPDGVITDPQLLGNIVPGQTVTFKFRARVNDANTFNAGQTTLVNMATATSSNTPNASDTASVLVPVAPDGGAQLSITKFDRNLTQGETGEHPSTNANPTNVVEFDVHVRSLATIRIDNVIVKDVLPAHVAYIAGTTYLNSVSVNDDLVTAVGLNIGSLDPNQEALIQFNGRVDAANLLPTGTTVVINTAQAQTATIPPISAQAAVIINNTIQTCAGCTSTGAGESIVLALLISSLITFMYVSYTKTSYFRRREITAILKDRDSDSIDLKL